MAAPELPGAIELDLLKAAKSLKLGEDLIRGLERLEGDANELLKDLHRRKLNNKGETSYGR